MLICELILALFAVVLLAIGPASQRVALVIVAVAGVDAALGVSISPAITAVAPLFAFLTAALTLAALAEQSGLSTNAASMLGRWARGNTMRLYALVCVLSAVVTSIVSLDGAVVVMVPLVRVLSGRFRAPFAPLFLGVVVVANASSVAVPQGNPTNLVVMGLAGLVSMGLGGLSLLLTMCMKWYGGTFMTGNPFLHLSALLEVIGVQFISLGLLGELVTRTYFESQGKRPYAVRTTLNIDDVPQRRAA